MLYRAFPDVDLEVNAPSPYLALYRIAVKLALVGRGSGADGRSVGYVDRNRLQCLEEGQWVFCTR